MASKNIPSSENSAKRHIGRHNGTGAAEDLSDLISRVESTDHPRPHQSHGAHQKGYRGLADASHTSDAKPTPKAACIAVAIACLAILAFAVYHVTNKVQAVMAAVPSAASSSVERGSLLHGKASLKPATAGFSSMLPNTQLPKVSGFTSNIQPDPMPTGKGKGSHVHSLKSHWFQMPSQ